MYTSLLYFIVSFLRFASVSCRCITILYYIILHSTVQYNIYYLYYITSAINNNVFLYVILHTIYTTTTTTGVVTYPTVNTTHPSTTTTYTLSIYMHIRLWMALLVVK